VENYLNLLHPIPQNIDLRIWNL